MERPILVGTDGSETATAALEEAILLARALGRPLHVVSAYKPMSVSGAAGVPKEFDDLVRPNSAVDAVLDDAAARARVGGVQTTLHSRTGEPAEAILDLAEEIDAGMIVVGNKGIGSMKRFVLGNVPSKVVHHSPCSTYVVHTS